MQEGNVAAAACKVVRNTITSLRGLTEDEAKAAMVALGAKEEEADASPARRLVSGDDYDHPNYKWLMEKHSKRPADEYKKLYADPNFELCQGCLWDYSALEEADTSAITEQVALQWPDGMKFRNKRREAVSSSGSEIDGQVKEDRDVNTPFALLLQSVCERLGLPVTIEDTATGSGTEERPDTTISLEGQPISFLEAKVAVVQKDGPVLSEYHTAAMQARQRAVKMLLKWQKQEFCVTFFHCLTQIGVVVVRRGGCIRRGMPFICSQTDRQQMVSLITEKREEDGSCAYTLGEGFGMLLEAFRRPELLGARPRQDACFPRYVLRMQSEHEWIHMCNWGSRTAIYHNNGEYVCKVRPFRDNAIQAEAHVLTQLANRRVPYTPRVRDVVTMQTVDVGNVRGMWLTPNAYAVFDPIPQNQTPIDFAKLSKLFQQAKECLVAAFGDAPENAITHDDISPEHIMTDAAGDLLLIDWGHSSQGALPSRTYTLHKWLWSSIAKHPNDDARTRLKHSMESLMFVFLNAIDNSWVQQWTAAEEEKSREDEGEEDENEATRMDQHRRSVLRVFLESDVTNDANAQLRDRFHDTVRDYGICLNLP